MTAVNVHTGEIVESRPRRTSVYIYADARRCEVLYIGMTKDLLRRDREHLRTKDWRTWATDRFSVEFPSRPVAAGAEALLIGLYRPAYNTVHRGSEARCRIENLHPWTTADDAQRMADVQRELVSCFEASERRLITDLGAIYDDLVVAGTVEQMVLASRAATAS